MNRIYPIGKKITYRHDYIIIKRCYVLFLYFCPGFNLENKSEMFKENLNLFNSNTGQKSTTSGLVNYDTGIYIMKKNLGKNGKIKVQRNKNKKGKRRKLHNKMAKMPLNRIFEL